MKILLITQNDVFFLPKILPLLISNLPDGARITSCVLQTTNPFGKKQSFFSRVRNTINTFGIKFFLYYGLLYAIRKLFYVGNEKILQNNSIKVVQLHESVNSPRSRSVIADCEPDLILSILGNEVFKKNILTEYRILNLHTGLLPKYRGLMPTFWAMLNEEKEIGVSVFFVDEGIDSGPIIVQKLVPIEGLTQKQVIDKTKVIGVKAICEAVEKLMTGSYELLDNNDEDSTYFKFPKRSDVEKFREIGARFF